MTAPSIYEFRNPRDWEAAMEVWVAENEPRFFACYVDYTNYSFGEDKCVRCLTQEDALKMITPHYNPENEWDKPCIRIEYGMPTESVDFIYPFGERARDNKPFKCGDHLDGGSRFDYWHAGIRRY